jgi:predicted TIM-barrel fold metal-dependent hydrolase
MVTIPRIISVDDHVVEPPTLWIDRLPSKYADRAPRVVRDRARFSFLGGVFRAERGVPDGDWCDWWLYDDLEYPFARLSAAVGFDSVENVPTTFDEIRPGTWKQKERLEFCGQTFYEREDKELALLCVRAYNDWVIDEWCAGEGKGRLIPLTIVPLWDAELAAEEIHRCARKGSYAVTFSENPFHLGLPSVHDPGRFWDPFFRACEETGTTLNMHIGSSSKMPSTSSDAPHAVGSVLTFSNTMGSMLDFLISGVFDRFPRLRVAYSEGQVGWMPFVLERADKIWEKRTGATATYGMALEHPPSSYIADRIWGCIFDDVTGLRLRNEVGMGQITFEVDYPHADSTFPHTLETATRLVEEAGLDQDEVDQLFRTNAIRAYGLERFGITS